MGWEERADSLGDSDVEPIERGNIDMNTRPRVKNADGSISTVRSMGVNIDGKEVLIPTVSDDGRIMSDDEAVDIYKKTGRHLGKFKSVDDSNRFAQSLHESEAKKLEPQGWEARADALEPEKPKVEARRVGLEGPGSKEYSYKKGEQRKEVDTSALTPDQPVNAVSKSLDKHGDLFIANHPVEAAKGVGNAIVGGVKDLGRQISNANEQAGAVIMHPSTLGDVRFRSEAMRGVNDTIMPFVGNRIVEAIGGPKVDSPEDKDAYPMARDLGNVAGMAVPVPIGEAVGAVKSGVKSLAAGATERNIERAAVGYGERVGKKARTKLEAKEGEPLKNVLAEEPELVRVAHAADPERAAAAQTVVDKGRDELKKIYNERDIEAGRKPVAQDTIARAEAKEQEAYAKLQEAKNFPEGTEQNLAAKREALGPLQESQRLRREAAAKISGSNVHGIRAQDVLPGWDSKISELKRGTQSDRDAAKHLEELRDKFRERFADPNEIIPTIELRKWQSDYQQRGYGKAQAGQEAQTAAITANQEASKIVGDPIIQHVTGMSYPDAAAFAEKNPRSLAGRLFKANEKVAVGNNILAGLAARKGMATPKPSRIDRLVNGIHGASAVVSHGATIPLTVAMKVAPTIPGAIDKGLIGLGKLAEKIPETPATYNPIGSVVKGTRSLVDRMTAIRSTKNTVTAAKDLMSLVDSLPSGYVKSKKDLSEANRLATYALDGTLSEDKRRQALGEAMDLLNGIINE